MWEEGACVTGFRRQKKRTIPSPCVGYLRYVHIQETDRTCCPHKQRFRNEVTMQRDQGLGQVVWRVGKGFKGGGSALSQDVRLGKPVVS